MASDRPVAIGHMLAGHTQHVRDPLTDKPLGFEDPALAEGVAAMLAANGFMAAGPVPPPDEELQIVTTEIEAVALVRVLVQDLRVVRAAAAAQAARN